MQYLVYVHNLVGGQRSASAVLGDAPVAPLPGEALASYARIWIDALEGDPDVAIATCIREALEWPREYGEKIVHMTATTSLEMELGPGFDAPGAIIPALQSTLASAALRVPPGFSKSA